MGKSGNVEDRVLGQLGFTREQFDALRARRDADYEEVKAVLRDPGRQPVEKSHAQCVFALKYGYNYNSNPTAFIFCPTCFLKPPNCVCKLWHKHATRAKVVVYMHHHEWGRGSNTGIVLKQSLERCEVLLKGHKEHEGAFEELLADEENFVVALYPGPEAMDPAELRARLAENPEKKLVIVAIDATWNSATKMKHRLPNGMKQVTLPPSVQLFEASNTAKQSLLFPIRQYGGDFATTGRVSTLEAVVALLRELEEPEEICDALLHHLKIKVDAMLAQCGKPSAHGGVHRTGGISTSAGSQYCFC